MQSDFGLEMKKLENKLKGKVIKDTFEIVEKIGKEEGFLMILEIKTAGIFYAQDHMNITDKIIKAYNLKASKTK